MEASAVQRRSTIEAEIVALENAVEPLFAAARYRDFFDTAHRLRLRFKAERLPSAERERLWARLNRCTEAAKLRQAREFAERASDNLTRWRTQLSEAERYAGALHEEVSALAGRTGPVLERALWQWRIAEKRVRLTSVEGTIIQLRAKIADVSGRR